MYVVGILVVLSAIGLLNGFWKKNFLLAASGLVIIIMAGAVLMHLQDNDD